MFFLIFQRFLFLKTLNIQWENNGNLQHLCAKTKKSKSIKVLPIKL